MDSFVGQFLLRGTEVSTYKYNMMLQKVYCFPVVCVQDVMKALFRNLRLTGSSPFLLIHVLEETFLSRDYKTLDRKVKGLGAQIVF